HLTRRTARGEEGQLTIGFTATATHTILPKLVREFRSRYPKVELSMRELSTEAQVTALNEGKIDIAFLHPPIDPRNLDVHPILEEAFIAVLSPQHPLAHSPQIPIEALANEPLIIHPRQEGPTLYDGFLRLCQQFGFQPHIAHESISLQTRVCLAAAGLGITFVSESLQSLIGSEVVCRPLANCPIHLEFAAAWRQQSTRPTLLAFTAILLAATAVPNSNCVLPNQDTDDAGHGSE
ncbi:MAG: LysR family substrate-binding domain-containing protein, partial [Cyanobacteria bacterium J06626_18]